MLRGLKEGMQRWERALVHDILVGERFAWSIRKLLLLAGSGAVALGLAAIPGAEGALAGLGALEWAGVLIAGALFAYGFTTLPAISALFLLSGTLPPLGVAFVGALAAMVSDLLLFRFARNSLREEAGFVPTPEWKERMTGEPWYRGDTYNIKFFAILVIAGAARLV